MEVFEKLQVVISHAVLVDNFTNTEADEEVLDFLKQYGSISRTLTVDDEDSDFYGYLIVEFGTSNAVAALQPLLPYTFIVSSGAVKYKLSALSDRYASDVGTSKTQTYLADLQSLAKTTGKDFAHVLKGMMAQIGDTIAELQPEVSRIKDSPEPVPLTEGVPVLQPAQVPPVTIPAVQSQARPSLSSLSPNDLNPPDVQRYVVEHIVKSEDHAIHSLSSQKLRVFSGKVPRPPHETDFDTWRSSVDLIMKDPAVSDMQRSRKILESLLPPAADMIKHLSPDTLPDVYLQQLDSAYGTVQDGDELFAKFMGTFQDVGELPSAYLQRLQVSLNLAVKRGGALEQDVNKHLLCQFCRGCWDNTLLSELQLTQKKSNPPSFPELLLLLRTEEDRKASKAVRMKQHLGATRQKVTVNSQLTGNNETDAVAALTTLTQQLAKQMADMQKQLAALTASSTRNQHYSSQSSYTSNSHQRSKSAKFSKSPAKPLSTAPKPGYCFQCGEDGHTKLQCQNPPNPSRVANQRRKFNEKLQKWQDENPAVGKLLN